MEVISDPLNDMDNDQDGTDVQRQLRSHQVIMFYEQMFGVFFFPGFMYTLAVRMCGLHYAEFPVKV